MIIDFAQTITVSELIETVGVSRSTVERAIREHELVVVCKLPGKRGPYLLDRASSASWVAAQDAKMAARGWVRAPRPAPQAGQATAPYSDATASLVVPSIANAM